MSIQKTCLAINFEAIFSMKNESIYSVLEMLEASGLRKFLTCGYVFNLTIVKQFFASARMEHDNIICTIGGSNYIISQQFFEDALELPITGLAKVSDLPNGNADQIRNPT